MDYYAASGQPDKILDLYRNELQFTDADTVSRAYRLRIARLKEAYTNARNLEKAREYQELYDTIDSTSMCLHLAIIADTLERVDTSVAVTFINCALSEYVQADVDSGVDAYKDAILSNIGNVELLGHIDEFYSCARQYADVSAQVVNQKRVVSDLVYGHFYGDWYATVFDYVRYLHELPEFNIYYSRMQNVRLSLQEIGQAMEAELERCKEILR